MTTAATTRFQLGTAALALAAAATLTPVVAQADSIAPLAPSLTSFSKALGDSAGQPVGVVCEGPDGTQSCTLVTSAELNALGAPGAKATDDGGSWLTPLYQNQLWWFGTPNPNPPPQTEIFQFYPIQLLPEFLQPLFGWFDNINYESCFLGWTTTIGPYGAVTQSASRGCA